jgi:class 3 adenylate cyclase
LSEVQDLPAGTVTFLFTDIEGSTALLKQLGPDRQVFLPAYSSMDLAVLCTRP